MKVLVTGASGFIGRHLVIALQQLKNCEVIEIEREHTEKQLSDALKQADFIYHLAGVNRPKVASEFIEGNVNFTQSIVSKLQSYQKQTPILMTSSIQATQTSEYGQSKKQAEEILKNYATQSQANIYLYRLPNVFGKWCRPYYNSVVATFCYQIARSEPIWVSNENHELQLVYIDDVIERLIQTLQMGVSVEITPVYTQTLGQLVEKLEGFKQHQLPNMSDELTKKLYSTYLSYLPKTEFSYPLLTHADERGSFTELLKHPQAGQFSVNITKPGFIKGNHWHHTKVEKFIVILGEGIIRLRQINEDEVIEYKVSGDKIEVIDIPVGYTHQIENIGSVDLITVMWANECFDKDHPDTYYVEV